MNKDLYNRFRMDTDEKDNLYIYDKLNNQCFYLTSRYDVKQVADLMNNFIYEKELIKEKLLTQVLDKHRISNDNHNFGLDESVESMVDSVKELFECPYTFQLLPDHDECKYFKEQSDEYGCCTLKNKKVDIYESDCTSFEWKI